MKAGPDTGNFEQVSPFDGVHRLYAYRMLATDRELLLVVGSRRHRSWRSGADGSRPCCRSGPRPRPSSRCCASTSIAVPRLSIQAEVALRESEQALHERDRFVRTLVDTVPAMVAYWTGRAEVQFRQLGLPCMVRLSSGQMQGLSMQSVWGMRSSG